MVHSESVPPTQSAFASPPALHEPSVLLRLIRHALEEVGRRARYDAPSRRAHRPHPKAQQHRLEAHVAAQRGEGDARRDEGSGDDGIFPGCDGDHALEPGGERFEDVLERARVDLGRLGLDLASLSNGDCYAQ